MIHKAFAVAALLALAACGARVGTSAGAVAALDERVFAQSFGDARPVDWPGREPGSHPPSRAGRFGTSGASRTVLGRAGRV